MNMHQEIQRLKTLFKNVDDNESEIIRVYYNLVKDRNCDSNVVHFLNHTAAQLLSPRLTIVLKKHRLEAFSYILVANNLLNLEDVKDDLLNGNALTTNTPSNTIRKLKAELGLAAPSVQPSTQQPVYQNSSHLLQEAAANETIQSSTKQCRFIKKKNSPIQYKLPVKTACFFWTLFHRQRISIPKPIATTRMISKTVVMDATGKRPTTMINYGMGTKRENRFNFLLIDEKFQKVSQAFGQTRGVIAYDIHYKDGFRTPYSLSIADVREYYGDAEGTKRDNEIASTIKQLFEHIHDILESNKIGFDGQPSHLATSKKFTLNSNFSIIIGKNVEENFCYLICFTDRRPRPILAATKEAKFFCRRSNKTTCNQNLNNRAPSLSNQPSDEMLSVSVQWEGRRKHFQSFFAELYNMRVKSQQLNKKVLFKESLQVTMRNINSTMQIRLQKMKELRKIQETINGSNNQVNDNEISEFKISFWKTSVGDDNSACQACHRFCNPRMNPNRPYPLQNISIDPEIDTMLSNLFLSESETSGKVCSVECQIEDEINKTLLRSYVLKEETRNIFEMRKKHADASSEAQEIEKLRNALQKEMEQLKSVIATSIKRLTYCSDLLKTIVVND